MYSFFALSELDKIIEILDRGIHDIVSRIFDELDRDFSINIRIFLIAAIENSRKKNDFFTTKHRNISNILDNSVK